MHIHILFDDISFFSYNPTQEGLLSMQRVLVKHIVSEHLFSFVESVTYVLLHYIMGPGSSREVTHEAGKADEDRVTSSVMLSERSNRSPGRIETVRASE